MRIELLPNGYYWVFDYASKLSGLYNMDGSYHSGVRFSVYTVSNLIIAYIAKVA